MSARPHIVYMLVDNLGFGNVGYLRARSPSGASPEVVTPELDALAKSGVILDRLYTYEFCSPSRSSLLSGRLPGHVNIHNDDQTMPGAGIPEAMTTMPAFLASAGYITHQIGKWCAAQPLSAIRRTDLTPALQPQARRLRHSAAHAARPRLPLEPRLHWRRV